MKLSHQTIQKQRVKYTEKDLFPHIQTYKIYSSMVITYPERAEVMMTYWLS